MELNREASALDQEHAHGRFALTRYILYLLPVIGFIGTVEGISKALMNISKVLPMVKELDGFLNNLTGVTHALNIAFDSTLLALFLSAALMFVQTLVHRRAEDLLARVDRWVVEHVLPRAARAEATASDPATLGPQLERIEQATVYDAIPVYLRDQPDQRSRRRKRMDPNPAGAQWALRLDELRVYYHIDVAARVVRVLRVGRKRRARVFLRGVETDMREAGE